MPGLAPIRMSVPASDGLVLKGELRYPDGSAGRIAAGGKVGWLVHWTVGS